MKKQKYSFIELKDKGISIFCDEKSRFESSFDNSRYFFMPCAVAKAKSARDVSEVLKFANKNGIKVVVRGAGTGCSAGALACEGELILDVSEINFIEINNVEWFAHVGAGAINAEVDKAANKFGLCYPPDPSSKKYSTIGGNIACNAGGLRAAKYGVTRNYVLALKVCLPNGEFLTLSRPLKKFAVGFNLRDLFIGAEGTLGVIVEAWLKLVRKPETKRTVLAYFKSDNLAFSCVQKILSSAIMPSVLEFMDENSVECAAKLKKIAVKKSAMLLIELDGSKSEVDTSLKNLEKILKTSTFEYAVSQSESESEKLWEMRRACSPAIASMSKTRTNQDIVLPITQTQKYFKYFKQIAKLYKLRYANFGHAADGNYHIHFMYNSRSKSEKELATLATKKAILYAIKLGGAASGEHGLGLSKTSYLRPQLQNEQIELMRSIKKVFDPNNILNSNVLFSQIDFSQYSTKQNLPLPWAKE